MSLTDEEIEIFSEFVDSVETNLSCTKSKDGSIYSTTYGVKLLTKVPKGGDPNAVEEYNRITSVNMVNNFHNNKRLKQLK